MSKKTVVSVHMVCCKCRKKVMKLVADIEGINSVVLDSPKGTVTIIGEADPAIIIKKVRKFQKSAAFESIGPAKDEKKDDKKNESKDGKKVEKKDCCLDPPTACHRCNAWYVIYGDPYVPCSIL